MSLEIMSFREVNEYFPLASVSVPCPQILAMNRRAKWSIIRLGTINSASCQVILWDSRGSSVGRRKVFKFNVSVSFQTGVTGNLKQRTVQ